MHGRIGRPVINTNDSINVKFGMSLIQILKVDEKNQVLETNVWETFVSITTDTCYEKCTLENILCYI